MKVLKVIIVVGLLALPNTIYSQTRDTSLQQSTSPYPKWRLLGSVSALRVFFLNSDSLKDQSSSRVSINTLDAAGLGLSWGAVTQKDAAGTISFKVSINFLLFVSHDSNTKMSVFGPALAIGLLDNLLQIGVGRDWGDIPNNSSRWFVVVSLSQSIAQWSF